MAWLEVCYNQPDLADPFSFCRGTRFCFKVSIIINRPRPTDQAKHQALMMTVSGKATTGQSHMPASTISPADRSSHTWKKTVPKKVTTNVAARKTMVTAAIPRINSLSHQVACAISIVDWLSRGAIIVAITSIWAVKRPCSHLNEAALSHLRLQQLMARHNMLTCGSQPSRFRSECTKSDLDHDSTFVSV